jgi:8-oxo-dGTP pyrophosphatase MutT (NUDIX family)
MRSTKIVTSFVTNSQKFLILKRSSKVKSMRGLWGGISGVIEGGEEPLERAKIEIFEEIGANDSLVRLLKTGSEMTISSAQHPDHQWIVYPFLFALGSTKITLNWENESYKWIAPDEIYHYKTVPSLDEVLFNLL